MDINLAINNIMLHLTLSLSTGLSESGQMVAQFLLKCSSKLKKALLGYFLLFIHKIHQKM